MTVNGREPDAKGNVVADPPDLTELEEKVDGLGDAVNEENQRAVGAEEELGRRIVAEESRAQSVERGLRDDMSSAQSAIADRYTKRETDEKIAAATPSDYDSVKGRVAAVEAKIPAQASAQNQLADKAFVNSSVATNTANYIYKTVGGRHVPFDSLAELQGYAGALTNNDYAFVVGADAAGNTTYTRYKWNSGTEEWAEEYVLNNSSFTAEQWAAISSGITSGLVAKLGVLPTAEALAQALAGKANRAPNPTAGNLAALDADGNPTDSGIAPGDLSPLVPKPHAALLAMRNAGQLVPGQQYRITDYVATTNGDMESQSANHPFDIIVTADDERTLNEHARAIIHEGDTYFADCDLAAWDVWYCLDNDTSRFAWALAEGATDSQTGTPGRGVVYRLVDEFHNDVPYDFKGVQFKAYGDTDNVWRYTFDSGRASGNTDLSLHGKAFNTGAYNWVRQNTIKPGRDRRLNRIVFKGTNCYQNTFDANCDAITFGSGCNHNKFGTFCSSNTFGDHCYGNTFGSGCSRNTFGAYCYANTFGDGFGNNTFGNDCYGNTFGYSCRYITFGSSCSFNTFGSSCYNIKFGTSSSAKSYCRFVRVGAGNSALYINPTGTTSAAQYYQNVEIKEGVNNTPHYKTIDDPNVGQTFLTTYKPADSQEVSL